MGMLLAISLTVGACHSAPGSSAAAPGTGPASSVTEMAPTSTTPANSGTTAPAGLPSATVGGSAGQPVSSVPAESQSARQAEFARALAAWQTAATASAATMNTYLQQAADDLLTVGDASYDVAIAALTFLAILPATNVTTKLRAEAQSDVRFLDSFFGTPGLLSS